MPQRMTRTELLASLAAIILSYLREIAEYVRKDWSGEKGILSFYLYLSDCLGVVTDWIFDHEAEAMEDEIREVMKVIGRQSSEVL